MEMPFGIFSVYVVLKLPEFLAYDWSIFSCLKPLVTKLEVLCGDMTGPLAMEIGQCFQIVFGNKAMLSTVTLETVPYFHCQFIMSKNRKRCHFLKET